MRKKSSTSIGAIGEAIYDKHNNRVKGFCTKVISSNSMKEFDKYLAKALTLMKRVNATRTTLRFVVEDEHNLITQAYIPGIEARVPLSKNWKGYTLIYFGQNREDRFSSSEILQEEDRLITRILQQYRPQDYNPIKRVLSQGYTVSVKPGKQIDSKDKKQILNVLRKIFVENGEIRYPFDLTENNIREIISESMVAIARDSKGKIVSVVIGEKATIPTDIGELEICEYSEEGTLAEHRRRGLSQACLYALKQEVLRKGVDLMYCEARACNISSNVVPRKLGFEYAGRLNKHCIIGGHKDIQEEGPFENLNVWYLP